MDLKGTDKSKNKPFTLKSHNFLDLEAIYGFGQLQAQSTPKRESAIKSELFIDPLQGNYSLWRD